MKTIRRELDIIPESFKSVGKYLPSDNYAVFDIETTGLSANFSSVILSGFVLVRSGKAELIQYFAEDPSQEPELLKETADLLSSLSHIITYNGRYFDVPFFRKRCEKYDLNTAMPFNLDLYNMFRYYSPLGKILPALGQKNLEEYAGIANLRLDRISGSESIELYDQYQLTRSSQLEEAILLHNSDDVAQLLRLMTLIKNCDVDRAFFKSGFPIDGGMISTTALKGQDLIIEGLSDVPSEYIGFPTSENPLLIRAYKENGKFEITVPCETRANAIYVDLIPYINEALLDNGEQMPQDDPTTADVDFITNCSGFVNNYLILKEPDTINYGDINALSKLIANKVLKLIQG